MARSSVPRRILRVRRLAADHAPNDLPRYMIVDAVRELRKWLEDPAVADEHRVGDKELLASFRAYLAETKGKNTMTIVTRAEIDARAAKEEAVGKTLH